MNRSEKASAVIYEVSFQYKLGYSCIQSDSSRVISNIYCFCVSELQDKRPEIPGRCPSNLAKMMKQCWDKDPKRRPEMRDVVNMLEAINTDAYTRPNLGLLKNCFCFVRQRKP